MIDNCNKSSIINVERLTHDINNLKERLAYLFKEADGIKSQISDIEGKLKLATNVEQSCQSHISKEEKNTSKPELSDMTDYDELVLPEHPIIPKVPQIKGLQDIRHTIWKNLEDLFHANHNYTNETITLSYPAFALTQIGKEIILIKDDEPKSESEIDEAYSIVETCQKIIEIKESEDIEGYKKYIDFFYEKYPLPANPFGQGKPFDFFSSQSESIYVSAYYFYYFLRSWANTIDNIYQKELSSEYRFIKIEMESLVDTINPFFIEECLIPICELASMGFRLAIIPILDEDIIYRPKRIAQTDKVYSLLYYDKYVDIPTMVNKKESRDTPLYSYSGTTFVSGHYRQGHWREGKWVNGGYVKSYYRK